MVHVNIMDMVWALPQINKMQTLAASTRSHFYALAGLECTLVRLHEKLDCIHRVNAKAV